MAQPYPEVVLLHHRSRVEAGRRLADHFNSAKIDIPRPHTGVSEEKVRCPYCDVLLDLRIHSIAGTEKLRRRWLLLSIAGWLVTIIFAPLLIAQFYRSNEENFWYLGGFALSFLGCSLAGHRWQPRRQQEDGVRVHDPRDTLPYKQHGIAFPWGVLPSTVLPEELQEPDDQY